MLEQEVSRISLIFGDIFESGRYRARSIPNMYPGTDKAVDLLSLLTLKRDTALLDSFLHAGQSAEFNWSALYAAAAVDDSKQPNGCRSRRKRRPGLRKVARIPTRSKMYPDTDKSVDPFPLLTLKRVTALLDLFLRPSQITEFNINSWSVLFKSALYAATAVDDFETAQCLLITAQMPTRFGSLHVTALQAACCFPAQQMASQPYWMQAQISISRAGNCRIAQGAVVFRH